jgi:hypothetical protein
MIFQLLFYLAMYSLDMLSSLWLIKKNSNQFQSYESNEMFKRFVNTYGKLKGALVYTLSVGVQMLVINLVAFLIAYRFIIGNWNFSISLSLLFTFMGLAHIFGVVSNILAMLKSNPIKQGVK